MYVFARALAICADRAQQRHRPPTLKQSAWQFACKLRKEFAGDSDMEALLLKSCSGWPLGICACQVMTDHFFPGKHLWEPWVRVEDVHVLGVGEEPRCPACEDHINTGFVLVKPTRPIRFLNGKKQHRAQTSIERLKFHCMWKHCARTCAGSVSRLSHRGLLGRKLAIGAGRRRGIQFSRSHKPT